MTYLCLSTSGWILSNKRGKVSTNSGALKMLSVRKSSGEKLEDILDLGQFWIIGNLRLFYHLEIV